jgi:hypothetical protein
VVQIHSPRPKIPSKNIRESRHGKDVDFMCEGKSLLVGIFCAGFLGATVSVFAQTDFNTFWTKFKTAVANNDKAAVASMTKFPLSMPYGVKTVRTKAEFLKHYAQILNMEANANRCFQATKPTRDGKAYIVWCTFKENPESSDNRPIGYRFANTKAGWKFAGLDNVNE